MADDGLRFEAWTMPHVGSFTRKFDFTKWIESYTVNDRFNDLSDGTLTIADDFPKRDQLFYIDEANHANDVGSVVRVLRGSTPIGHYIITRSEDSWSDGEPTHKLTLEGLEWILDRALVPHYDYPADPTMEPDWIYGADTLLSNPGLEDSPPSIEVQHFEHTQTSSTYTITYSGQTTSAIDWDDGWFEVHQALEALSNIQDVVVTGDGSRTSPFIIEFLDPSGNVALMTTTATGGIFTEATEGGVLNPAGWTKSFHPQTGQEHGVYTTFEVSNDTAHTGTYSLKVVAAPNAYVTDYPGVQQIMTVTGGRTYRMSIWVYASTALTFRLICRTMDETLVDGASVEVTVTANTWTEMVLDPFVVPKHISQVIYRLGLISVDGGTFYVDDGVFAPGFPAATLGFILDEVRTAALAVSSPLAWLTPTWSTTLDSDGNAWDRDLKWNVNHDQTFLQLQEYARRWNYEFRPRWDVGDNRFEWDIWNPLGGGQTRTLVAITGKSGVTSAPIVKRPPEYTYMRVEGEIGRWGEFASTTLDDKWGRLERAQQDRQGVFSEELEELAERLVTKGQDRTATRSIQVEDPSLLPWSSYEPGDTVTLNLAPKDTKRQLRVAAIVASMSPGQATPRYDIHFGSPVLSNDAALAQGLRTLLREFRRPASMPPAAKVENPPIRFGLASYIAIAAHNSSGQAKAAAHFVCDGTDDHIEWQLALDALKQFGGELAAAPGDFNLGARLNTNGMERDIIVKAYGAVLHWTSAVPGDNNGKWLWECTGVAAGLSNQVTLAFLGLEWDGDDGGESSGFLMYTTASKPDVIIRDNTFTSFDGRFLYAERGGPGNRYEVANSTFRASTINGGYNAAPSFAAIQLNEGNAAYSTFFHDSLLTDIVIPSYYGAVADLSLPGGISIAHDNIVINCSRSGGGGSMIIADALHDNHINGTYVP